MSKLTDWNKQARWNDWQKVLEMPIVQEALAVIEEEAAPNAFIINKLAGETTDANAGAFKVAIVSASQAGQQAAVRRLRLLGRPPPQRPEKQQAEPYSYITEENYEQYLTT